MSSVGCVHAASVYSPYAQTYPAVVVGTLAARAIEPGTNGVTQHLSVLEHKSEFESAERLHFSSAFSISPSGHVAWFSASTLVQ